MESEAKNLGQLGLVAAELGNIKVGLNLTAISYELLDKIGSSDKESAKSNLYAMAEQLGLNNDLLNNLREESIQMYNQDGGGG